MDDWIVRHLLKWFFPLWVLLAILSPFWLSVRLCQELFVYGKAWENFGKYLEKGKKTWQNLYFFNFFFKNSSWCLLLYGVFFFYNIKWMFLVLEMNVDHSPHISIDDCDASPYLKKIGFFLQELLRHYVYSKILTSPVDRNYYVHLFRNLLGCM